MFLYTGGGSQLTVDYFLAHGTNLWAGQLKKRPNGQNQHLVLGVLISRGIWRGDSGQSILETLPYTYLNLYTHF